MSQSGLSQGMGMSQGDMSQDSVMLQPDLQMSQLDNLLSQDSTYQGDRFASQNQFLSQFSQVTIPLYNKIIIHNMMTFSALRARSPCGLQQIRALHSGYSRW